MESLFHEVALQWVNGGAVSPEVESWEQFTGRVRHGVDHVLSCCRDSSNAVIFTSGGPSAVSVAMVLKLSPRTPWIYPSASATHLIPNSLPPVIAFPWAPSIISRTWMNLPYLPFFKGE